MENFDLKATRNNLVATDTRLIQNSRYSLSSNKNKALMYLISKIQPGDSPQKKYLFNCEEFRQLIRWQGEATYTKIKAMLKEMSSMRWWIDLDDNKESLVTWFNIVHMDKGTGDIEISFHEDIFPYLFDLQRHLEEDGQYFTSYKLQNITLMKCHYSPRIYEILKSYQYNNKKWIFENGTGSKYDLQRMIGDVELGSDKAPVAPKNWTNWALFKRDVLDPAVKEINKYTDIKVAYAGKKEDIHKRKTRAIRTIEFYMVGKTELEQKMTDDIIDAEYIEIEDEGKYHQMTIEETFFQQHEKSLEEDKLYKEKKWEEEKNNAKFPLLHEQLNMIENLGFDEEKLTVIYAAAIGGRVGGLRHDVWESLALELIMYYYEKIKASPERTKTTLYDRLCDSVRNDYDNKADNIRADYLMFV